MLTIFADQITARLNYTLSIIFEDRGIAWQVVDNVQKYQETAQPKIAYSKQIENTAFIKPSRVLFDKDIRRYTIEKSTWNKEEIISFEGTPDVLASIFYVISLYDNYLQEEKDQHERNKGVNSLLHQFGWLEKLMIERWSLAFIDFIEKENDCSLNVKKLPYKCVPTFDIDNAYAYRLKGLIRKSFSILKDVVKRDVYRLKERRQVLNKKLADPYDTFDKIKTIAQKNENTKLFWLLGDYGRYDKNISHTSREQKYLIQKMSSFALVGLHPSYRSNYDKGSLKKEKARLEIILKQEVKHTRQHFLKVKLPDTFRALEEEGFTDDYSLAYADQVGFRAGTARSFMWFDLMENKVSNLRLHPVSYMDGTLNEYMKLSVNEAMVLVDKIKKEVQKYGGNFTSLWHNETIGDYGVWKGWSEVLEKSIAEEN